MKRGLVRAAGRRRSAGLDGHAKRPPEVSPADGRSRMLVPAARVGGGEAGAEPVGAAAGRRPADQAAPARASSGSRST